MKLDADQCLVLWCMGAHIVPAAKRRPCQKGMLKVYIYSTLYQSHSHHPSPREAACRSFADSKTLKEEKRDSLFQEIAEDASIGTAVDILDARTISAQMLHGYCLPNSTKFETLQSFCSA